VVLGPKRKPTGRIAAKRKAVARRKSTKKVAAKRRAGPRTDSSIRAFAIRRLTTTRRKLDLLPFIDSVKRKREGIRYEVHVQKL